MHQGNLIIQRDPLFLYINVNIFVMMENLPLKSFVMKDKLLSLLLFNAQFFMDWYFVQ